MGVELPKQLLEAMESGRLVLFLGAGVSSYADPDLPGRTKFLLELGRRAGISAGEEKSLQGLMQMQGGFRQYMAADFIARRLGRDKLFQACSDILKANRERRESLEGLKPLHDINFRFAITTNYDTVVERSAEAAGRPLRKYTHKDLEAVLGSMRDRRERFLFKIHGDLGPDSGSPIRQTGTAP